MRLEDLRLRARGVSVDRPPLPSWQQQGGFRCGGLCNLPGTQHHGPAPGDRSAYTIFADSTAATERIRSDATGPGQRFAVAATEVCTRLVSRDNEVAIRWVPAQGNETADEMAKAAAEGNHPEDAIPDELRWETSLSHMARVATENR